MSLFYSAGQFGAAIPGSVVDNFEDESADPAGPYGSGEGISDYYSGVTGSYNRNTTDPADGSYGLEFTGAGDGIYSHPGDGLPEYPNAGDTVSWLAQDSFGGDQPAAVFHVESGTTNPSGYAFEMDIEQGSEICIEHWTDVTDSSATRTTIAGPTSISKSADTYYYNEAQLKTDSDSTLVYTLYELNADLTKGSEIASVSGSDTSTSYSNRGIGWQNINGSIQGSGSFFDRMRID